MSTVIDERRAAQTIHQEVLSGDGLYLTAAAKQFPRYRRERPVSASTVFRWITRGVVLESGVRVYLEATRLAGKWLTSRAALARFLAAQTPSREQRSAMVTRTPSKRDRAAANASAELARRYNI